MLNAEEMSAMFLNDQEIEAYASAKEINKIRVGHESFVRAIEGIKHCMKASVYEREPMNCMLLGEGGAGKTSLADVVMRTMRRSKVIENDLEINTVPAFYTSFKNTKSLDSLTTDMLRKLGDPYPESGKNTDKADRVLRLLINCRTAIVFVDELHDLDGLEEKNMEKKKEFFKWIKQISNECGPMICLMGTDKCHDIFDNDPEMARRFKNKFALKSLSTGTRKEPGQLQSFLSDVAIEIVKRTKIRSMPNMADYLMALRVYCATSGSPDFIMTLFKASVRRALLEGRASIEFADYSEVWESGVLNTSSIIKINPFTADENQIAAAMRRAYS